MVIEEDALITFLQVLSSNRRELEKANLEIDKLSSLLQRGYGTSHIESDSYKGRILDFLNEVAKSRLLTSEKFTRSTRLWLDRYSASYSTPENVGNYRSSRLKGNHIVDVGCGAGMQAIMFAGKSAVTGIEKDPVRSVLARLNAAVYDQKELKILNVDAFDKSVSLGQDDVLFSDPLRSAGKEEKTFSTLTPNPITLLDHFDHRKRSYAFDLPPTMPLKNIELVGEREFISIRGKINRLTVYSPSLQTSPMTAVLLPSMIVVRGEMDSESYQASPTHGSYLSIPDESLVYSHLLNKLYDPDVFGLFSRDKRRIVLTSDKLPKDMRIGEFFETIGETDQQNIRDSLKKFQPSKIFPRFELDSSDYYEYVSSLSNPLWVGESLYLFRKESRYVLARKIDMHSGT